ncbi:putative MFS-type transporter YfcJ [Cupriavidus yeoncheonensis]|uniref:MFS-type transporter YfcJ n=1 Tax=Cupriavidus yeoncheonensis TaxID=1462994 RepID=A0A916MX94_9BURK|nr:arabinose transporter [Cupriavidus yeoncheonensis]CAG2153602.1 putative MFS-type transporter YfcJ [Cupriavidus yeoncheonensis]
MNLYQPSAAPTEHTVLSLMACVFAVFLVTGAALPALPLYIHDSLGFSTFTVGLVSGAQFTASLLCRLWSGTISDRRGPKFAVTAGLMMAMLAGLLYLGSLMAIGRAGLAIAILLVGRVLLGGAESFIMIGAQSWCLSLSGPSKVGRMIAWIGTAMFVALALGAPLGSVLFKNFGFASIGLATLLGSAATLLLVSPIPATNPAPQSRKATGQVLKAVWIPGVAMAFSSLGYGIMTAFAVLLFVQRGWQPAWLSFTAFAVSLMAARVLFGPLPDRLGGARTAAIFIAIHSAGLALIWLSPEAWLAFVGSAMAGFGYALVYPGFGMEAMARAPAQARGLAMGVYTAFIDLALGIFTPLLGLVANVLGLDMIFLIAALLALCAVPIAMWLRTHPTQVPEIVG